MNTENLFAEINASPELTKAIHTYTDHMTDQIAKLRKENGALWSLYSNLVCSGNYTGNPLLAKLIEQVKKIEEESR